MYNGLWRHEVAVGKKCSCRQGGRGQWKSTLGLGQTPLQTGALLLHHTISTPHGKQHIKRGEPVRRTQIKNLSSSCFTK